MIPSTPIHVRTSSDPQQQSETNSFWAVELDTEDQALLDQAFERDPDLRGDTAAMFGGLIRLDLRDVFIGALIRQLRALGDSSRPVRAVLPALEQTLATARERGQARAAARWGRGS